MRAAAFAEDWADAHYERGETQSFYNDFFAVFGVNRRRVASYEAPVRLLGDRRGYIDLFWKGILLVEQKSAGRNLARARTQALDYFPGLKDAELPRYILVSDFQTFELYDLETDEALSFRLSDLPAHVERFAFILGVERRTFRDQDPVNILAAELMGSLHDALKLSGYTGHSLERLLVRLVFCLFADDTGVFEPRDIFLDLLRERTSEDGADTGQWLARLFQVLNTPDDARQTTLDEDLRAFPYINGDLFAEQLPIADFDSAMRAKLIEAAEFSWGAVSPAVFGSLFQSVMSATERRRKGAHYTTEKNILKVIQPLFLDDLQAEFERLSSRRDTGRDRALEAFHDRLAALKFLDPACGCGNFLVITYRELRDLELQVVKARLGWDRRRFTTGQFERGIALASLLRLNVDQFFGIEKEEFPARIAEVAMWMTDHLMNNRASLELLGETYARIPLRTSPTIVHGDALEVDWNSVLPAKLCSYVLGNPPFSGFTLRDEARAAQVRTLSQLGAGGSRLDYVAYWFLLAGQYVTLNDRIRIGFVSTNSVTQGEQVPQLWPALFSRYGLEIAFAHQTFEWGSDARGKAHVHVVIIGLASRAHEPGTKRLFMYDRVDADPDETSCGSLSPYLFSADNLADRHLVVRPEGSPLWGQPPIRKGVEPIDDGHYILSAEEVAYFQVREPAASALIYPLVGGTEYINGHERWIIVPYLASPEQLRALPLVRERIARVREYRRNGGPLAQKYADEPTRFHVLRRPTRKFLVIPEVSSIRREYIPIGWLSPPALPSGKTRFVADATAQTFAVLTSRMHMSWVRHIGGRVKSDYSYSGKINYNPFPWPNLSGRGADRLEVLAQAVLDARAEHPNATLSDLYDPDLMPSSLRRAHRALDTAVDRLYRSTPFSSDLERVEHLLGRYERATSPVTHVTGGRASLRKRARRT